jgi:hypothetical protein
MDIGYRRLRHPDHMQMQGHANAGESGNSSREVGIDMEKLRYQGFPDPIPIPVATTNRDDERLNVHRDGLGSWPMAHGPWPSLLCARHMGAPRRAGGARPQAHVNMLSPDKAGHPSLLSSLANQSSSWLLSHNLPCQHHSSSCLCDNDQQDQQQIRVGQ